MNGFIEICREHEKTIETLPNLEEAVDASVNVITETILNGGKILTAGNGGSACDAMHFSSELIGRLDINRKSYPSLCLSSDPSVLTCVSNDYGYEQLFKRQLEGLLNPVDCVVVFSTSGNSENIANALKYVQNTNAKSIAFLGKGGGFCKGLANIELIIHSEHTARIQEAHILITHAVCKLVQGKIES
ncbi:SIS domain-containing protein [Planktomarina temperata]|nr:SIS domain-containing protein [Planktomarina temperata]